MYPSRENRESGVGQEKLCIIFGGGFLGHDACLENRESGALESGVGEEMFLFHQWCLTTKH
ncbi:MAG TPA: hypothetical protein DCP31_35130 [Cyanobacteria bacterium UBA8543]|nr:hypothetical protein [Cyanobacteria bacterium UBA8543]